MKLITGLLLVILAISCCSAAGAKPCPIMIQVLTEFLFAPESQYLETIAPFAPSREMKEAAVALKKCALNLPEHVLAAKGQVLHNVLRMCYEM